MASRDDRMALRSRVEQLEREIEEAREARAEDVSDELRHLKEQLARAEAELAAARPETSGAVNVVEAYRKNQRRRVRTATLIGGATFATGWGLFLARQPLAGTALVILAVLLRVLMPNSECPRCRALFRRAVGKYCPHCTAQLQE